MVGAIAAGRIRCASTGGYLIAGRVHVFEQRDQRGDVAAAGASGRWLYGGHDVHRAARDDEPRGAAVLRRLDEWRAGGGDAVPVVVRAAGDYAARARGRFSG